MDSWQDMDLIRRLVHLLIPSSTRVAIRRGRLRLRYAGWSRWCPVCGSRLRRFLPDGIISRPEALCPVCESFERQRLFWLYLREELSNGRRRRVLHMAPEKGLSRRLQALPGIDYVSADPYMPWAMMKLDLTRAPFADCTFDVILISHVLCLIREERLALSELRRLLKPDGWILMSEGFRDGPTLEDPHAVSPEQRKAVYGDPTYVRRYGDDFRDRLQSRGGLVVTVVPFGDQFDAVQRRRMGLGRVRIIHIARKGL